MSSSVSHLVVPDTHSHPDHSNERFDWLSKLISDLKPSVVVHLGDGADMASLCSYDRGTKSFEGRTYERDIEASCDAEERLWKPLRRKKKKLPFRVRLIGNHEQRINKALEMHPELAGAYSMKDLQLDYYYDEVVPYFGGTPGVTRIDGVNYAHYLTSGVLGRAISGEHPAYSLLAKQGASCTVGHIHIRDFCQRTTVDGRVNLGLVAGVYQDYFSGFAGLAGNLWWRGVVFKENVNNGQYDHRWISLEAIKKAYKDK